MTVEEGDKKESCKEHEELVRDCAVLPNTHWDTVVCEGCSATRQEASGECTRWAIMMGGWRTLLVSPLPPSNALPTALIAPDCRAIVPRRLHISISTSCRQLTAQHVAACRLGESRHKHHRYRIFILMNIVPHLVHPFFWHILSTCSLLRSTTVAEHAVSFMRSSDIT